MKAAKQGRGISILPIFLKGEVRVGDSLPEKLARAIRLQKLALKSGDILVVKHKIVSKAEGRVVELAGVKASAASRKWAERYHLDARVTEVALSQGRRIVRRK